MTAATGGATRRTIERIASSPLVCGTSDPVFASAPVSASPAVIRVAFQGELGAYGDDAIAARWRGRAQSLPAASFADVIAAVADGAAELGVVPVWNTIVGDVIAGCEAVALGCGAAHALAVVDEVQVAVQHQLLAPAGATLEGVRTVVSHPTALAQCGAFLARHRWMTAQPVYDTAGAARELARWRTPAVAAVAGRSAAERYGLTVLASDIQDVPDNVTRFAVLARASVAMSAAMLPACAGEAASW